MIGSFLFIEGLWVSKLCANDSQALAIIPLERIFLRYYGDRIYVSLILWDQIVSGGATILIRLVCFFSAVIYDCGPQTCDVYSSTIS